MYESCGCEPVRLGLTEYLEGALPPGIGSEFGKHLRTCAGCERYLRQIRWTIDHLAALPKEPMPPGRKRTLLHALHRRPPA